MTLNFFSDMELFCCCEKTAMNYFKNYLVSGLESDKIIYENCLHAGLSL